MEFCFFTLEECLKSDTALNNKIENLPSFDAVMNLRDCLMVVDLVRRLWGKPITVSSGFRSDKLNKLVGGVSNSAHLKGHALDLQTSGDINIFFEFFKKVLLERNIPFDELILERSGKTVWLHYANKSFNGQQRRKIGEINL